MASMLEVYERIKGRDYSKQSSVLGRPSERQTLNAPLAGESNIKNEQQLYETYEPEETGVPSETISSQSRINQGQTQQRPNVLDRVAQGVGFLKTATNTWNALSSSERPMTASEAARLAYAGQGSGSLESQLAAAPILEDMGRTSEANAQILNTQPADISTGDVNVESAVSDAGDSGSDAGPGLGESLGRVAGGLLAAYKIYKLTQNKEENTLGDYATTGASVVEAIYPNPYTEAVLWGEGARKTGQSLQQQKTALPKTTGHAMSGGMSDAILYLFGKDKDEKSQAFLQYTGADPGHWAESIMTDVSSGHIGDAAETFVSGGLNKVKDKCIIVTACTSPDSEEVNISRRYRDNFLTIAELRGYYMIAEKVVPIIQKYPIVKRIVKNGLVDNLIQYGRYALGVGEYPSFSSRIITKSFLSLCRSIGNKKDMFIRSNGEAV